MKRLILIAFAFSFVSLQPFAQTQTNAAQVGATIEGVVLDAGTGLPLKDVRVGMTMTGVSPVAFNPPELRVPPTLVVSDSMGRFSIETTEVGRFRVVPTLEGYIFFRPGQTRAPAEPGVWVQLSPGQRIQNLELRMARPAVISGRVLDSNGQAISGTAGSVALMRYTYGTDGNRTLGWIPGISYPGTAGSFQRMNDLGEFRFYDFPPGEYYLSASGGGGAIGSSRTFYYPGVTEEAKAVPIRVTGGEEIRLDTLNLPPRQKGVEVRLRIPGVPEGWGVGKRAYIADSMLVFSSRDNPGEIVIGSVAPGHYDVVVRNDSFQGTGLFYGRATIDVSSSNVEQEVMVRPGARIAGKVLQQNEAGDRSAASASVSCSLRSRFGLSNCAGSQVVPGLQEIELSGLPIDTYILSAKSAEKDILAEGFLVDGDAELEIVLASPGAIAKGTVRNAGGETLPGAVVALVPESPFGKTGLLYKSVISDPNGRYEIHGIAPGSYKLFALPELEGLAYRNSEFMKAYEDRGTPAKIDKGASVSLDLTAF